MFDLKKRKSDWSATSAKGGQFESAETDQFGRHVQKSQRGGTKMSSSPPLRKC